MTLTFEILPYWGPIYNVVQLSQVLYNHFKDLRDFHTHLCKETPKECCCAVVHCKSTDYYHNCSSCPDQFYVDVFATLDEREEFEELNMLDGNIFFYITYRNEVPYRTTINNFREGEYFFLRATQPREQWEVLHVDKEKQCYVARFEKKLKIIVGDSYPVISDYFDPYLKPKQFLHGDES